MVCTHVSRSERRHAGNAAAWLRSADKPSVGGEQGDWARLTVLNAVMNERMLPLTVIDDVPVSVTGRFEGNIY